MPRPTRTIKTQEEIAIENQIKALRQKQTIKYLKEKINLQ